MGELAIVTFEEKTFTLSMVRWGFLRRRKSNKQGFMRLTGASFIPKYEIAVYDGKPSVVFKLGLPETVFYYPDKQLAMENFHDLRAAIAEGGIFGERFRRLISAAEPQKQHVWAVNARL
jgi:hypothetical protein